MNFSEVRHAIRQLLKHRAYSIVVVLTLGVGIGGNSMIFSVLNRLYLQPLPFSEPNELIQVAAKDRAGSLHKLSFSQFTFLHKHSGSLQNVSGIRALGLNVTGVDEPVSVQATQVSEGFFESLRVRPLIGRIFDSSEYQLGAHQVAVLSHEFWQRSFSGTTNIVGQTARLNDKVYRIIGVLPSRFTVPVEAGNSDLWLPLVISPEDLQNHHPNLAVIGRLKTAMVIEQARLEIQIVDSAFRNENPARAESAPLHLSPLKNQVDGRLSTYLLMLSLAVFLVLMISCANVVNLSLSHSLARRKEMAIRLAVGASRFRIIRQLLTESVVLSSLGGASGILLAWWSARFVGRWIGAEAIFDFKVLAFTLAISLITGILSGFFPAYFASRVSVNEALKDSLADTTVTIGPFRLRQIFVMAQVAMSLSLLLGAGLMIRSLLEFGRMDPGFDPRDILSLQIYLPTERYRTESSRYAFFQRAMDEAKVLPGVKLVGATSSFPIYAPTFSRHFRILGTESDASERQYVADINRATASYLAMMKIPLLQGRHFTELDRDGSEGVAIIDETSKKRFFGNVNPVGQVLDIETDSGKSKPFTIIGVARRAINVGNDYELEKPRPIIYVPYSQYPPSTMTLLVQTDGQIAGMAMALRSMLRLIDLDLPLGNVRSLEGQIEEVGARNDNTLGMMTIFAILGLLLAAVGIFGVVSFTVGNQTREIGIRMALGAQPWVVQAMYLKQGLLLASYGICIGIGGGLMLTRYIESLLYGVSSTDLLTYVITSLFVLSVALIASYFPARRAALLNPMIALGNKRR